MSVYQLHPQLVKRGYKILKSIGKGAFGEVFLVEDRNGNRLAMKEVILDCEIYVDESIEKKD